MVAETGVSRWFLWIISGFLVFVSYPLQAADLTNNCRSDESTLRCVRYVKNHDGDTLTFDIPGVHPLLGKNISVRVRGIDTAEISGSSPCEKQAARTAQKLVENLLSKASTIHLTDVGRDKYFRILADVEYDGNSLKAVLIKNRLGYDYDGGSKKKINWCERLKP